MGQVLWDHIQVSCPFSVPETKYPKRDDLQRTESHLTYCSGYPRLWCYDPVSFMKDWLHFSMTNGTIVETHARGTCHMVRPQEAREQGGASLSLL